MKLPKSDALFPAVADPRAHPRLPTRGRLGAAHAGRAGRLSPAGCRWWPVRRGATAVLLGRHALRDSRGARSGLRLGRAGCAADPTRPSLRDRLPADLRDSPSTVTPAMGFTPLYQSDDEWAAELINRTVHGVIHLGWVPDGAGGYRGQMAILVKPNGLLGHAYMAAITPFRLSDRLPAHAERSWPKVAVVQRRSIVAAEGCDYADAFEVPMSETDDAAELVRAGLQGAWLGMVLIAHRHVLRFELAPAPRRTSSRLGDRDRRARQHQAARNRPTPARVARGETSSAVECRARDVRQLPATVLARIIWTAVAPIHRAVVPFYSGGRLRLPPGGEVIAA